MLTATACVEPVDTDLIAARPFSRPVTLFGSTDIELASPSACASSLTFTVRIFQTTGEPGEEGDMLIVSSNTRSRRSGVRRDGRRAWARERVRRAIERGQTVASKSKTNAGGVSPRDREGDQ
jgi:hypothetical protein